MLENVILLIAMITRLEMEARGCSGFLWNKLIANKLYNYFFFFSLTRIEFQSLTRNSE